MSTLLTPTGDLTDDARAIVGRYARRFARPCRLDPDDLHQESVLYLLERAAGYDPARGSLATWLFWVCRRSRDLTLAQARLVRGRRQRPEPLPADPASPTPGPAEAVERADLPERVRDAVAALPAAERELVTRRFGLGGGEPANLRGLLPGRTGEAARLRLRRATDRLRAKLAAG